MQLNQLQPKSKRARVQRVGRGGTRGKTSGRGMKGQKARAGHSLRPEVRDLIKKLPKMRGRGVHGNKSVRAQAMPVNVSKLERLFEAGDEVTPRTLLGKKAIRRQGNSTPRVKLLGYGTLTKKLSVSGCSVSERAKAQIEKAGGSIA